MLLSPILLWDCGPYPKVKPICLYNSSVPNDSHVWTPMEMNLEEDKDVQKGLVYDDKDNRAMLSVRVLWDKKIQYGSAVIEHFEMEILEEERGCIVPLSPNLLGDMGSYLEVKSIIAIRWPTQFLLRCGLTWRVKFRVLCGCPLAEL